MVVLRLKGINRVTAKGRVYYYHRKTGTRLPGTPGSREFLDALDALNRGEKPKVEMPAPGTMGALMAAYRMSPEFTGLADSTKADYREVMDYLAPLDGMPVAQVNPAFMYGLRDRAFARHKRRFANYVLQVTSRLFSWGQPRGYAKGNPVAEVEHIRRPRDARQVNRPWTEAEIRAVFDEAPIEMAVAVAIGLYAGLREGDVIRVTWSKYDGRTFESRQSKTGAPIWIPAHPELRAILDRAPKKSPIIVVGARGRPFQTESGFRANFFKLIRRLQTEGKVGPGMTFHGLRHTVGTMLADAGCDTRDIMAITGHKTEAMVAQYTKTADQHRRANSAMAKLEQFTRQRQKRQRVAKPSGTSFAHDSKK